MDMNITDEMREDSKRIKQLALELAQWFQNKDVNPVDAHFAMIRITAAFIIRNAMKGADPIIGMDLSDQLLRSEVCAMLATIKGDSNVMQ